MDKKTNVWTKEEWQNRTPFPDLGDQFPLGKCKSIRECQRELWELAKVDPQMAHSNSYVGSVPIGIPAMQLYCYGNQGSYEKDTAYMKRLYPGIVRRIQTEVEDMLDSLEYDNSIIYDAYPDKEVLQSLIREVYERVLLLPGIQNVVASQGNANAGEVWNDLLYYLTEILFYQELVLRRNRK